MRHFALTAGLVTLARDPPSKTLVMRSVARQLQKPDPTEEQRRSKRLDILERVRAR